jgi:hypothetical protein
MNIQLEIMLLVVAYLKMLTLQAYNEMELTLLPKWYLNLTSWLRECNINIKPTTA